MSIAAREVGTRKFSITIDGELFLTWEEAFQYILVLDEAFPYARGSIWVKIGLMREDLALSLVGMSILVLFYYNVEIEIANC